MKTCPMCAAINQDAHSECGICGARLLTVDSPNSTHLGPINPPTITRRRFHLPTEYVFATVLLVLAIFGVEFYLTRGSDIDRLFWGVFSSIFGTVILVNGRGEKEESEKEFYIVTPPRSPTWIFPRASSGPEESENQRRDFSLSGLGANMIGLSLLLSGILLLITGALLAR